MAWDPSVYLQFADERLRPALDLLARVPLSQPRQVIDLGCGAGNVTALLHKRFPQAEVSGVDGSATMLEKARAAAPGCRFVEADIGAYAPPVPPDLIYTNAALQWLPGHESLFPALFARLAPGGALAVQMPNMTSAPYRALQVEVASEGPWAALLDGIKSALPILSAEQYWDLLAPQAAGIDMWETIYMHALAGEDAVVRWACGTSLRPYLAALPEEMRPAFLAAYRARIDAAYPRRPDGVTLLPFRRLFLIARHK